MRRYRRHRLLIFFKKFEKAWLISAISNDAFRTMRSVSSRNASRFIRFTNDKVNFRRYHSSTRWLAATNNNAKMPSVNHAFMNAIRSARLPDDQRRYKCPTQCGGVHPEQSHRMNIEGRGRRYLLRGLSSKGKGRLVNVTLTSAVYRGRVWGGEDSLD